MTNKVGLTPYLFITFRPLKYRSSQLSSKFTITTLLYTLVLGGALATNTCWVAVDQFPEASVARHVTAVIPYGKPAGALLLTTGLGSVSSETMGVPKAIDLVDVVE